MVVRPRAAGAVLAAHTPSVHAVGDRPEADISEEELGVTQRRIEGLAAFPGAAHTMSVGEVVLALCWC